MTGDGNAEARLRRHLTTEADDLPFLLDAEMVRARFAHRGSILRAEVKVGWRQILIGVALVGAIVAVIYGPELVLEEAGSASVPSPTAVGLDRAGASAAAAVPGAAATPSPTPHPAFRTNTAWVAVEDSLYLFGGSVDGHPTASSTVFNLRAWRDLPPLPAAVSGASAVYVQDDGIYVLGGEDARGEPVPSVHRFDLSAGSWSPEPAMQQSSASSAAAAVGNKVYVFGGVGPEDPATVQVFDVQAREWTAGPAMPEPLADAAALAMGDDVYLFGGSTPDGDPSASAFRFDAAAGAWTRLPDLPAVGTGLSATAVGADIWVLGVRAGTDDRWITPLRFEPASATWTVLPEQVGAPGSDPAGHAAMRVPSGQIMVLGGGVPMLIETAQP